jgi:hypothetical protein
VKGKLGGVSIDLDLRKEPTQYRIKKIAGRIILGSNFFNIFFYNSVFFAKQHIASLGFC